ncbi:hypothetical protein [Nonomuraea mesophila]|nr:hypothetical protein [Nonomuraea mesophila]
MGPSLFATFHAAELPEPEMSMDEVHAEHGVVVGRCLYGTWATV